MKKILSMAVGLLLCIGINAQITRSIWNCTLGETTRAQVVQEMSERGYRGATGADGSYNIQFAQPVEYAGVIWTHVSFDFVDGILSYVSFQNKYIYSRSNIDELYAKMKSALDSKYAQYYDSTKGGNNGRFAEYNDETTLIDLALDYYQKAKYVSLSFYDVRLNTTVIYE